jgi:hypothetical protein
MEYTAGPKIREGTQQNERLDWFKNKMGGGGGAPS